MGKQTFDQNRNPPKTKENKKPKPDTPNPVTPQKRQTGSETQIGTRAGPPFQGKRKTK